VPSGNGSYNIYPSGGGMPVRAVQLNAFHGNDLVAWRVQIYYLLSRSEM